MKSNCRPERNPSFELKKVNGEIQLTKTAENSAVYINETAAIIWQLCDGRRKVGEIKKALKEAYPDAGNDIAQDVDEVLELLSRHRAVLVS
jgi:hypothetical protein